MTRTCSAPTPPDRSGTASARTVTPLTQCALTTGFTLVELLIVLTILGLLVMVAQVNLFPVLRRQTFHAQVQDFVSLMQMVASKAAESGHRYEVMVDPTEQSYLVREITSSDLSEILDEEIISQGRFGQNCRLVSVEFDDGTSQYDGWAKFRIGRAGWSYGGKIIFIDESEQPYAVLVNRLNPIIELVAGDPPLMTPKAPEEVPFL